MIYFDNAATGGRKPPSVINAVHSSLKICANPGRSGHKLSVACAKIVRNARVSLNSLFGGFEEERVIFTKNCTEALNIAIFSLINDNDEVITTCMEHNSVLRPLEFLKQNKGINYKTIPLNDGKITPNGVKSVLTKDTKAAIITLASNVTGAQTDIKAIKSALPPDVILICDGAQACGHFEINMRESGIDVLAVAGHKGLGGIQGSGALLFSARVNLRPLLYGGTGSESMNLNQPDFYPDMLESGTLNFPAIVSLFEGSLYTRIHIEENSKKIYALTDYLIKNLAQNPKIELYSKANSSGIVAFSRKNIPSEEVAQILSDKYDIAVRGGFHCAPLMHKALNTDEDGLIRASLSEFNNFSECDAFISAMRKI